jgi:alpha-tubulin suppressor-like RCC1 family protein
MAAGEKFVSVSAGGYVAMALTDRGDVYAWGYNLEGQCGDGAFVDVQTPKKINGLSNIKESAMGGHTGAALGRNGLVYTWGQDGVLGELGDAADRGPLNLPANYSGLTGIRTIHAAFYHMAAIGNDGQVYTWGFNAFGRVGNGTGDGQQKTPYTTSITNGKSLAGYAYDTLVVTDNGELFAAGGNNYGELGYGYQSEAENTLKKVQGLSNVELAASCFDTTSVFIGKDLYSCGHNGFYEFGNNINTSTPLGGTHWDGKWTRPAL